MEERLERARRGVMRFLEEGGYSESVRCAHRRCILSLSEAALETGGDPTTGNVATWLETMRERLSENTYEAWRIAAYRFADAWENDVVTIGVGYAREGSPYYARLSEWARLLAGGCIGDAADGKLEISRVEASACARLLLFACESGARGANDLVPALVVRFVARVSEGSSDPQSLLSRVKHFLRWLSRQGGRVPTVAAELSSVGYARRPPLCLGVEVPGSPTAVGTSDFILLAEEYVGVHLVSKGYAETQVGCARMALRLAFCFLVLSGHGYSVDTVLAWLAANEGPIGTQWKSYRRAVRAFERWRTEGADAPHVVFRDAADLVESAPEWSRRAIRRYLELTSREGAAESTLAMCKSACVRFCAHSSSKGASGFADITPPGRHLLRARGPARHAGRARRIRAQGARVPRLARRRGPLEPRALARGAEVPRPLHARRARPVPGAASARGRGQALGLHAAGAARRRDGVARPVHGASRERRVRLEALRRQLARLDAHRHAAQDALGSHSPPGAGGGQQPRRPPHGGKAQPGVAVRLCVFLSLHAPYEGVGRKACANALARVLGDLAEGCHGFHELRRTFATGMLRGGSGIGQIADALGHASEGSVRAYLSPDERRMRDCALPLSMLGGGGVR